MGTPRQRTHTMVAVHQQLPRMGLELVEGSVIERGHQVGSHRTAIGGRQAQRPRLCVARMQTVAERCPLPAQLLVGQRQLQRLSEDIALPALDEGKMSCHAIAVLGQVRNLDDAQLVGELQEFILDDTILADKAVVERHILKAAADLDAGRVLEVEGVSGAVEPALGTSRQTLIGHREEIEGSLGRGCVSTDLGRGTQLVVAGRERAKEG